jgi:ribosome-associated protein
MLPIQIIPDLSSEFTIKAVRSSGKGGQNVNKVSTKVELYFNIAESVLLSLEQKTLLQEKLSHLLNSEGELRVVCEDSRSQLKNKQIAIDKLYELFDKALLPVKKRVKTKTPKSVIAKRIKDKKIAGEKKSMRKKPDLD